MAQILHIDFETASEIDLITHGLDRYARHASTRVLMCGYALDDAEPKLWFPSESPIPAELRQAIKDPTISIAAHNAQFEDAILVHVLKANINPRRYIDTMLMAYYCSLPGDLFNVCRIVGVAEDEQKLRDGKKLINLFCMPRENITKAYPQRWLDKTTHPEEWKKFCDYCVMDVSAERAVYKKLKNYDLPAFEKDMIVLDRKINKHGMPVDRHFVINALKMYKAESAVNVERLRKWTGLENPMSNPQFLNWAIGKGYPLNDLKKGTVVRVLADMEGEQSLLKSALELRAGTYKAALKKYDAMRRIAGEGDMLRYMFQYYGAQRTGRYAGRKVQLQNLARPAKALEGKLERVTDLVRTGNADQLSKEFRSALLVLPTTVRSALRAREGKHFVISDLSAIEDRVLAWFAGCERILQEHRDGLDPYKAFGVYLFNKAYDDLTKQERNDSKPGKLGCFGENTVVLTDAGWKRIVEVSLADKVHDGVGFVSHGGVVPQGVRVTLNLSGVRVTKEHEILIRESVPGVSHREWLDAERVARCRFYRDEALSTATKMLGDTSHAFLAQFYTNAYVTATKQATDYRRRKQPVYDILNAGRKSRFVILTGEGPLIVHNCGYRLGAGGTEVNKNGDEIKTGLYGYADAMGIKLSLEQCQRSVKVYREQYPEIVQLWYDLENAVERVIHTKKPVTVRHVTIDLKKPFLRIRLPCGRHLHYLNPRMRLREFRSKDGTTYTKQNFCYDGVDSVTKKWGALFSHGGKLAENITQAAARDILCDGIKAADKAGFTVVGHAHDEIIAEEAVGSACTHERLSELMSIVPTWAPDLPLAAHGFESVFYKKD